MGPGEIGAMIPIVALIAGAIMAIGIPIARAHARRIDSRGAIPSELNARLERMEQSIEAIAVEVERITEGQRFTTKLLADRFQPAGGSVSAGAAMGTINPPGERRS